MQRIQHDGTEHPHEPDESSPFAPQTPQEVDAMLSAIGADSVEELFDVPEAVAFDGDFDIESKSEYEVVTEIEELLGQNADRTEFLGRGHYDHYVPSVVDYLSLRSEFLTSYTQYQPETSQGFLQALFEFQSMIVELTGLDVANCSMYDAATALGEAALLAARVRETSGSRVLVPETIRSERRSVLENYADGAELAVETYPLTDGNTDVDVLGELIDEDVVMVYAESPTARGAIEERLSAVATLADDHEAAFCLGSDPVALALLKEPAAVGADIVIGDASVLGLSASHGMGLGLFAVKEGYLRQVPGRLVGTSETAEGRRAYTLTLQTREQHIRKERATSNICTNQAWVALRTAIHIATLGASGLAALAEDCVATASEAAARLDAVEGVTAPVDDRHHFREFVARTERPASEVASELADRGFLVHEVGEFEIQICVTETNSNDVDGLVAAVQEVLE
ncbi:aminomethyl-transferring glycine dehydrogenase subunit GcvPA [Halobellus sp. Atlit-38R]|uniref:aminomethyl-transferring glycine dehydrogenase subunit GcvPA n=1 Tax=Halobellus sp. Atlit-38R TaxID=2282131 RepID=UPI000EF26E6A|nr:aminomethyl-transferring glycine dehydrogenase subunit GcvPA [Halobellus sp. Atlit-38R]RLM87922.1 aminomethyl-transferring glycine dehydrogenase subunit GcvPA [Halobellus sp. Atlit-38R]